jgi:DNA-binding NarL/FixJ family response regulator
MLTHKKRIVVFDENETYNSILNSYLKKANLFKIINTYLNFDLLIENLKTDKPDIVLMDIPSSIGTSSIEKVKRVAPKASVIIVSENEELKYVTRALRAGADGYVIKHLNSKDLINELNKTHQGGVALSSVIARNLVQNFWIANNNPLSQAEIRILKLISKARSYTTIARDLQISKQTVKVHTRNIYRKLNVHCKAEAIALAQEGRLIN